MKNLIIIGFLILITAVSASAKYTLTPLAERIEWSDLLVVGTLVSVEEIEGKVVTEFISASSGFTGKGILVVEEVLAGSVITQENKLLKKSDRLLMNWYAIIACDIGWHRGNENKKGIWLLRINKDGIVNSRDFVELSDLKKVKELLQQTTSKIPIKKVWIQNPNNINTKKLEETFFLKVENYFTIDTLIKGLLVFIFAITLFCLFYRLNIKFKVKREKLE